MEGFVLEDSSELVDLDIRSALTLGTITGDNEVFKDVKNGINITANSSLQTSNGGGVEGDIAYAIANHSANVTYIKIMKANINDNPLKIYRQIPNRWGKHF